ncbi:hypothetical protein Pyrde_1904 [Pyrodictium delaneyi]|uniref:Uncharacterized protein n=1 Tax=Pyrodictium delaneyi TaxID=1273541 RepID=A0A0P0N5N8_9CREN|nr:hypothetical protein [Pyrodictium delaneyi]ALL01947.1 hypothetical protein Pyrde_1904 [Pyrodictium delaneyi]
MTGKPLTLALAILTLHFILYTVPAYAASSGPYLYHDQEYLVVAYYRFGNRIAMAQNNSKVFSPVTIEVFSKTGRPVSFVVGERKFSLLAGFGEPARHVLEVPPNQHVCIQVVLEGSAKRFCFYGLARERAVEEYVQMTVKELAALVTRVRAETLAAALAGILAGAGLAWLVKTRLVLLDALNPVSLAAGLIALAAMPRYWWLSIPMLLGLFAGYWLAPSPPTVALVKPDFSNRRLKVLLLPVYYTSDGRLAAALQDFKATLGRLRGSHVYVENTVTGEGLPLSGWSLDIIDEKGRSSSYEMLLVRRIRLKRRRVRGDALGEKEE